MLVKVKRLSTVIVEVRVTMGEVVVVVDVVMLVVTVSVWWTVDVLVEVE